MWRFDKGVELLNADNLDFHSADWLAEFQRRANTLATAIDSLGHFLEDNPPENKRATDNMHRALKNTGNTLIDFSKTMSKEWLFTKKVIKMVEGAEE